MKGRERTEVELLAPLVDAYASTPEDRDRVLHALRARLGPEAFPSSSAASAGARRPPNAPPGTRRALLKLVGVAGVGALVASGAVMMQMRSVPASESSAPAVVAPGRPSAVPAESMPAPRAPEEVAAVSVSVDELPPASASASAVPARGRAAVIGVDGRSSEDELMRETELLSRANQALRAGDAPRAAALFDQHAREFPNGVLADERVVGQILALCALGRRDEAAVAARRFVRSRPQSPLTRRIASSCAGTPLSADPRTSAGER